MISGIALLISLITAVYTFHKNRDLTHVIFNKPLFITSKPATVSTDPEAHGTASDAETHIKTAIEIINASNHNRGYFDYKVMIISNGQKIHFKNIKDTTSGNLGERSHHTLIFEGKSNQYVHPHSNIVAVVSVKLVKRRVIPFLMYQQKRKSIESILWGTPMNFMLEETDLNNDIKISHRFFNIFKRR